LRKILPKAQIQYLLDGRVTEKIAMAVDKEGRKLYPPRSEKSAHAIELPLGFCDKYGIKVGDVIKVSKLY
jgi:uncharacterized membrane protein (UPF0127 family)